MDLPVGSGGMEQKTLSLQSIIEDKYGKGNRATSAFAFRRILEPVVVVLNSPFAQAALDVS